jgi:hypothetical protein
MFSAPNIGIDIAKGWCPDFEALCSEIDLLLAEDKMGFHWVQCKEKFGSARLYFQWGKNRAPVRIDIQTPDGVLSFRNDPISRRSPRVGDDVKRRVEALIAALESKTRAMCIVCGDSGKLHNHGGYVLVLCSLHAKHRVSNLPQMESPWFDS